MAPTPGNADGVGLMILFDCVLRKGHGKGESVINLADWIRPVTDKVAADNGVPHWGLIDFGKGSFALAVALEAAFKERPPAGTVMVDSYSPEGRAVKDVLVRWAEVIVQGVR